MYIIVLIFLYFRCSERNRSYDIARFHNRVRTFPFADHNPPPLIDIEPLCKDIANWLDENQKNVAVVHCKAGKVSLCFFSSLYSVVFSFVEFA